MRTRRGPPVFSWWTPTGIRFLSISTSEWSVTGLVESQSRTPQTLPVTDRLAIGTDSPDVRFFLLVLRALRIELVRLPPRIAQCVGDEVRTTEFILDSQGFKA